MGNTNQSGLNAEPIRTDVKILPLTFHDLHSDNIQLSSDRRRARRIETFCKGISFSSCPVPANNSVHIRFAEVSTSWSGAVRFGFTSHNPASLSRESLPRYACPDLTNHPGYWAKALPERLARLGSVLSFRYTITGDVLFAIDGEEKGVFFTGISTKSPLWALVDVYGNSTCVEFVDGHRRSSRSENNTDQLSPSAVTSTRHSTPEFISSLPNIGSSSPSSVPIRHINKSLLMPLAFSPLIVGRNICLSPDRTVAVRRVEDYCNAYVFTPRPLHIHETVVIQVLSVDPAYTGGLAFGVTCCNPETLRSELLPDDSDLLLDRPEYWVVNKDVCAKAEVADELTFYLAEDGAVHYGRNGHHVASLMHVDHTLPMWAFFDVYGSVQKIKFLGVINGPPQWQSHRETNHAASDSPPPRPPPMIRSMSIQSPPSLPPKQPRPLSHHSTLKSDPIDPHTSLPLSFTGMTSFPAPPTQAVATIPRRCVPAQSGSRTHVPTPTGPSRDTGTSKTECEDNSSNECAVCLERPPDCVLYMCGHMCMCYRCALGIHQSADASCPICRQPIIDIIKIYRT